MDSKQEFLTRDGSIFWVNHGVQHQLTNFTLRPLVYIFNSYDPDDPCGYIFCLEYRSVEGHIQQKKIYIGNHEVPRWPDLTAMLNERCITTDSHEFIFRGYPIRMTVPNFHCFKEAMLQEASYRNDYLPRKQRPNRLGYQPPLHGNTPSIVYNSEMILVRNQDDAFIPTNSANCSIYFDDETNPPHVKFTLPAQDIDDTLIQSPNIFSHFHNLFPRIADTTLMHHIEFQASLLLGYSFSSMLLPILTSEAVIEIPTFVVVGDKFATKVYVDIATYIFSTALGRIYSNDLSLEKFKEHAKTFDMPWIVNYPPTFDELPDILKVNATTPNSPTEISIRTSPIIIAVDKPGYHDLLKAAGSQLESLVFIDASVATGNVPKRKDIEGLLMPLAKQLRRMLSLGPHFAKDFTDIKESFNDICLESTWVVGREASSTEIAQLKHVGWILALHHYMKVATGTSSTLDTQLSSSQRTSTARDLNDYWLRNSHMYALSHISHRADRRITDLNTKTSDHSGTLNGISLHTRGSASPSGSRKTPDNEEGISDGSRKQDDGKTGQDELCESDRTLADACAKFAISVITKVPEENWINWLNWTPGNKKGREWYLRSPLLVIGTPAFWPDKEVESYKVDVDIKQPEMDALVKTMKSVKTNFMFKGVLVAKKEGERVQSSSWYIPMKFICPELIVKLRQAYKDLHPDDFLVYEKKMAGNQHKNTWPDMYAIPEPSSRTSASTMQSTPTTTTGSQKSIGAQARKNDADKATGNAESLQTLVRPQRSAQRKRSSPEDRSESAPKKVRKQSHTAAIISPSIPRHHRIINNDNNTSPLPHPTLLNPDPEEEEPLYFAPYISGDFGPSDVKPESWLENPYCTAILYAVPHDAKRDLVYLIRRTYEPTSMPSRTVYANSLTSEIVKRLGGSTDTTMAYRFSQAYYALIKELRGEPLRSSETEDHVILNSIIEKHQDQLSSRVCDTSLYDPNHDWRSYPVEQNDDSQFYVHLIHPVLLDTISTIPPRYRALLKERLWKEIHQKTNAMLCRTVVTYIEAREHWIPEDMKLTIENVYHKMSAVLTEIEQDPSEQPWHTMATPSIPESCQNIPKWHQRKLTDWTNDNQVLRLIDSEDGYHKVGLIAWTVRCSAPEMQLHEANPIAYLEEFLRDSLTNTVSLKATMSSLKQYAQHKPVKMSFPQDCPT